MKKWLIFIMAFMPLCSFAQSSVKNRFEQIPVKGDKVVFADTILSLFNKDEIRQSIYYWINTAESKDRSISEVKNNHEAGIFSCKVTDYLMISRSTLTTFPLYMLYTLSFEYKNSLCIVSVHDINYIEPSDFEQRKNKDIDNLMIPAELPLVEKKYNPAFVKNASEKIIEATLSDMNLLITSIRGRLNP